jgi:hypothetical protein
VAQKEVTAEDLSICLRHASYLQVGEGGSVDGTRIVSIVDVITSPGLVMVNVFPGCALVMVIAVRIVVRTIDVCVMVTTEAEYVLTAMLPDSEIVIVEQGSVEITTDS